jgi:hypothetical protein
VLTTDPPHSLVVEDCALAARRIKSSLRNFISIDSAYEPDRAIIRGVGIAMILHRPTQSDEALLLFILEGRQPCS